MQIHAVCVSGSAEGLRDLKHAAYSLCSYATQMAAWLLEATATRELAPAAAATDACQAATLTPILFCTGDPQGGLKTYVHCKFSCQVTTRATAHSVHNRLCCFQVEVRVSSFVLRLCLLTAQVCCCLQVVVRDGSAAINCADMLPRRWGNYMRGTDAA